MKNFDHIKSIKPIRGEGVSLLRNENPRCLSFCGDNLYPDVEVLRKALAERNGVNLSQIILGAGATGVINCCAQIVSDGETIAFDPITYLPAMKPFLINGAIINQETLVGDYRFIVHPNNPTCEFSDVDSYDPDEYLITFVDEAYIEYTFAERSFLSKIHLDNLIVIRTMSKFYGLAGARVGYAIISENLIEPISKLEIPYCISNNSIDLCLDRIKNYSFQERTFYTTKLMSKYMVSVFNRLNIEFYKPCANFITAKINKVPGFDTRDLTSTGLPGYQRITLSDVVTMRSFVRQLEQELKNEI